ncbi:MAG: tetratricopeptide repeat protein [Myxococcota bacterium]|nr:tetratricopeptide repeat protein [Myxococcota bacterium]
MRALALTTAILVASTVASSVAAQRGPSPRAARLIRAGEAYLRAGDRGSAIGYFREALQADPRSMRAYERLGEAYRARGSHVDAREVFEAGLARDPDHAPLWLGLARTLLEAGQPEEAARAVRSLLARDPDHREGLRLRAELARARGAWSEALTAYRALLSLDDLSAEERAELRRYEAALRLLARPLDPVSAARACAPDAPPVRRALARCE